MQFTGRVERVGWGQTRIRGTDTRPTYVPNAQFAQAAVTNNERITHRKFETIVPLRFQVTKSTTMCKLYAFTYNELAHAVFLYVHTFNIAIMRNLNITSSTAIL